MTERNRGGAPRALQHVMEEAMDDGVLKNQALDLWVHGQKHHLRGDLERAIEWLEKAKMAPRYEPRHFPYMNLGRIYAQKGMVLRAIREFEAALEFYPGEPTCLSALGEHATHTRQRHRSRIPHHGPPVAADSEIPDHAREIGRTQLRAA